MNTPELSMKAVWVDPTPEILALHDKTLLVTDPAEEAELPFHFRISRPDPAGPDSGRVAVCVWQTWATPVEPTGPQKIPTKKCNSLERYLTPELIQNLKRDGREYDYRLTCRVP